MLSDQSPLAFSIVQGQSRRSFGGELRGPPDEFSAPANMVFFVLVGQEPEMADAHESRGQNMKEEAADKLVSLKTHPFHLISIPSVPIGKRDHTVSDRKDAVVGNRHPEVLILEA